MLSPASLRSKAGQLRKDARSLLAPVADAFRRRAAELELEAFLLEQQLVPATVPAGHH
jgi:hypothetical protein